MCVTRSGREKTRVVYYEVSAISRAVGPQLCDALPGLHAFSGCDSVSPFSGKGKKNLVKLCKQSDSACQIMTMVGKTFSTDDVLHGIEEIVSQMYGKSGILEVDECRYSLFASKQSQSHCIPLCRDALKWHTFRANYQTAIWRRALEQTPQLPSPEGHGWKIKEGQIDILWTTLPPAPDALLELIVCSCSGDCSTRHCSCTRNGVLCTDSCRCTERCCNTESVPEEEDAEDEDFQ